MKTSKTADGSRYVTARLTTEQFNRFRSICDRNHISAESTAADAIEAYCDLLETAEVRAIESMAAQVVSARLAPSISVG